MKISSQTIKKIEEKIGNLFRGEFKSVGVESTVKPKSKPTPTVVEPVIPEEAPKVETTLEDESTAIQIISHGEPTQ